MVAFDPPIGEITASRTLVKSEPELLEMMAELERLGDPGIRVTTAEKGFGTRVEITAEPGTGCAPADLEELLDQLAEPRRRPFTK